MVERVRNAIREAVLRYLDMRGRDPGPLFLATTGYRRLRPSVTLRPNGLKQMLRRRGRDPGLSRMHAHRFRHTFGAWAIEQDAREIDVQYLLGHSTPDMVRRYASTYNSEQAARRHQRQLVWENRSRGIPDFPEVSLKVS